MKISNRAGSRGFNFYADLLFCKLYELGMALIPHEGSSRL